jgi:SEC-C motif-containing protein
MTTTCYCNSGQFYANCCGPLLAGIKAAATPEALMRSRYSAFCCGNVEYLLQTHLTDTPSAGDASQIRTTMANTKWLKLEVLRAEMSGDEGLVEFIAYYRDQSGLGQLHERSEFLKKENRWFYTRGIHLPTSKPQRNAACWCGSGKKFKKCCGT